MLFMLLATDADDTLEARLAARPQHLARLQQLQDENRLILASQPPARQRRRLFRQPDCGRLCLTG